MSAAFAGVDLYLEVVSRRNVPWSLYYLGLVAANASVLGLAAGGVTPFDLLPDAGWAGLALLTFGLSAIVQRRPLECTDGHRTSLCFHSLTALLLFAELSRVFRFLYTLSGRVASSGARAHFHLDPVAHEERTVATLTPLFETVVRVGPDGVGDVR